VEIQGRYNGDTGEIQWRYRGDTWEVGRGRPARVEMRKRRSLYCTLLKVSTWLGLGLG
jgi:hypothetical protein